MNYQLFVLITWSFLQKLGTKRRKTVANRSSKIDKTRKALLWLLELTPPSSLRPKKIIIETQIVWAERHMIWAKWNIIIATKKDIIQAATSNFQKLVLVLVTFVPVTKTSKKNVVALNWISCICYLIWFEKNKVQDKV